MKRSLGLIIAFLVMSQTVMAQEKRTFSLKSGEIINGQVVSETDSSYQVITSFGSITLLKSQIQAKMTEIELEDGNVLKGELVDQSTSGVRLITAYGEIFISAENIKWMGEPRLTAQSGADGGRAETPASLDSWYFSDERLMDIWFDPTGFALRRGEFYFSGLSWAVGLTEKVQISSNWSTYFLGDFNVRPKLTLINWGNVESFSALSVGAHLHLRGSPNKWEYVDSSYWDYNYDQDYRNVIDSTSRGEWVTVGSSRDDRGDRSIIETGAWGELFAAFSSSKLNSGNKGRTNITAGASVIFYSDLDPLPRLYLGVDRDVRRNIKIMAEVFWDPYYAPLFKIYAQEKSTVPVYLDLGFMTNSMTRNKKLWLGVHYQSPYISFYFKF